MTADFSDRPVIIIGMHRSGTTMVSEMLERLGLFIGKKKDINAEAVFFLRVNEWLLQQAGGSWDNASGVKVLLADENMRRVVEGHVRNMIGSPMLADYLGWRKYLKLRGLDNMDFPWGWKDPRNTFTLPMWADLFPQAKVIHVYRHGIDVARSLKVRVEKLLQTGRIQPKWQDYFNLRIPRRSRFAFSPACSSIMGGFQLWETYMEEARSAISSVGCQVVEIKYETFLTSPAEHLARLASFCGLEASDGRIREVASKARADRAFAFKSVKELIGFEENVAPRLARYGY